MDGVGLAAVITASSTALLGFLALLGSGIRYVVKMILDAYKKQVEATEQAKNDEIAALNARIERQEDDKMFLRQTVDNQADTISSQQKTIEDLRRQLKGSEA